MGSRPVSLAACLEYATLFRLRIFYRRANRLFSRVDVRFRDCHVSVPGTVGQRPRVHVSCPTRQARVTQGIKRERLHLVPPPRSSCCP